MCSMYLLQYKVTILVYDNENVIYRRFGGTFVAKVLESPPQSPKKIGVVSKMIMFNMMLKE